jgi:hypothetical protein
MSSIVPQRDEQDIYLVEDDGGASGPVWCEAPVLGNDFEAVVMICWRETINARAGSRSSISLKAGCAMRRPRWFTNCGGAAISSSAIYRRPCMPLPTAMKDASRTCNCRCQYQ